MEEILERAQLLGGVTSGWSGRVEVADEDHVGVARAGIVLLERTDEGREHRPLLGALRVALGHRLEVDDDQVKVGAAAAGAEVGGERRANPSAEAELIVLGGLTDELDPRGVVEDPELLPAAAASLRDYELPSGEQRSQGCGLLDLLDGDDVGVERLEPRPQEVEVLVLVGEVAQVPGDHAQRCALVRRTISAEAEALAELLAPEGVRGDQEDEERAQEVAAAEEPRAAATSSTTAGHLSASLRTRTQTRSGRS